MGKGGTTNFSAPQILSGAAMLMGIALWGRRKKVPAIGNNNIVAHKNE